MSDARRFGAFAAEIERRWPDRLRRIADVAGGKGYLNAALYRLGYRNVVTFDKRKDRWTARGHYRFELFSAASPRGFELVVGMHPDGGTDEAIAYAARRRVPFAVVPCCIVPSAYPYEGAREYDAWLAHLIATAEREGFTADVSSLPIRGRSVMLAGDPREKSDTRRQEAA